MWLWLQRLHRWQLEKALNETRWEFPLRRGYEYFDAVLSEKVHNVPKLRFQIPFDYSLRRGFYGFWDKRIVYIRLKLPSTGLREFFGTARGSHFKGIFSKTNGSLTLVGSYRVLHILRIGLLIFIYIPIILVLYGLIAVLYLYFQYIKTGKFVEFSELIMGVVTIAVGGTAFWCVGYVLGKFYARSSWREREDIRALLMQAAG